MLADAVGEEILRAPRHATLPTSDTACPQARAVTDWQEINRISKYPQAVRSLARRLLELPYVTWPPERPRVLRDMARSALHDRRTLKGESFSFVGVAAPKSSRVALCEGSIAPNRPT